MVLQVLTNTWKINDGRDAGIVQDILRAMPDLNKATGLSTAPEERITSLVI
jgi:hypothetical protein